MLKRPCTWTKHPDLISNGWQSLGVLQECSYPITDHNDPTTVSYITEPARDDVEEEDDGIS